MVSYIQEAVTAGARESQSCKLVGISQRSVQRWRSGKMKDSRNGALKTTARQLTAEESQDVFDMANQERFADLTTEQIVAKLSQEGIYLASSRTFSRILNKKNALNRRQDSKMPITRQKPPQRIASAPNQVWTWDITWLKTDVKGIYFYAYVIMDLYDRSIVGWSIHECESGDYSRTLFERICRDLGVYPIFLHSDKGNAMKALTLIEFRYSKNILPRTYRPRVSNDNPFSDSLFKTMKYRAGYLKLFSSLAMALGWFAGFVIWYNNDHMHSSLEYVTPKQLRNGLDFDILAKRNRTFELAKERNPLRWGSRKARVYKNPNEVILNAVV